MFFSFRLVLALSFFSSVLFAQTNETAQLTGKASKSSSPKSDATILYLDVHHFGPGKVTFNAVMDAHKKDLIVEKKYGVHLINFWFDEARGDVYCLANAPDSQALRNTHAEAHGLLPDHILLVQGGKMASANGEKNYFLDLHELGAGKVTLKDVAAAHQKDLAVQKKYGVNLINYWVNEKEGIVMCLAQAPDSSALIKTHAEAHGLIPVSVEKVQVGK